jgi:spermidine/putrescine-binding protein
MDLKFAVMTTILIGLFVFAGCQKLPPDTNEVATANEDIELNIYTWEEYFDEDVIADFEKEFGISVNIDTYEDQEILYSVLQADPTKYDLIFPDDDLVRDLIKLKLVAPLDKENIPNLANIDKKYLDWEYDPDNVYTMPLDWGTTGILYNSKFIDAADVGSWDLIFNQKYAGKIANLDSPVLVIGYALKMQGYSLNSDDVVKLNEVKMRLIMQKNISQGYLSSITLRDKMIMEELWAVPNYNGDAQIAINENPDLRFYVPREGSDLYLDVMAVPVAAPHKRAAEEFINFVYRPQVHARITAFSYFANPNRAAHEQGLIGEEYLTDSAIYPPAEIMEKLEQWNNRRTSNINKIWSEIQLAEQ